MSPQRLKTYICAWWQSTSPAEYWFIWKLCVNNTQRPELALKYESCLFFSSPGCLWARVSVWAASKNWKCESCGLSWWEKIDRIWWTGRRAKFSILFTEAHPLQLALWALHGKEDRYEKLAKSDPVSDLETNNMWLMKTESRKMDPGNVC